VLTFFPVREAVAGPNTSHHGAARHIEKEALEVRQSNLKMPANIMSCTTESNGRVRHDERGVAVWDWSLESGVFNALSSSALLRRLDVAELKVQESPGNALAAAGREGGGGGDPYNFRGVEGRDSVRRRTRVR
jgi:hypothetical protein